MITSDIYSFSHKPFDPYIPDRYLSGSNHPKKSNTDTASLENNEDFTQLRDSRTSRSLIEVASSTPQNFAMEAPWTAETYSTYNSQASVRTSSRPSAANESPRERTLKRPQAMSSTSFLSPPSDGSHVSSQASGGGAGSNPLPPPYGQHVYPGYHGQPAHAPDMAHSLPVLSPISSFSSPHNYHPYHLHTTPNMGLSESMRPDSRIPPAQMFAPATGRMMGGFSSSPALHQLSPVSPTTQIGVRPSSGSTDASSFPNNSILQTPSTLPKADKRDTLDSERSYDDWDEEDGAGDSFIGMGSGRATKDQPWGMPQDEYKALAPRDKKQVRNRIGARRFRAKRKDYVNSIEAGIKMRDEEIAALRSQIEQNRRDINDLRARLGLPPLPREDPSGLGLSAMT